MIQNGTLDEQAQIALVTDKRHRAQYEGLRRCDGAFQALVSVGNPQSSANGGDDAPPKSPEVLYAEYMHCVSTTFCPSALHEWYACVKQVRDQEKTFDDCAQAKRLLERCLRGETQTMLRASQPAVFPHGADK